MMSIAFLLSLKIDQLGKREDARVFNLLSCFKSERFYLR
jgi:hypothetical protein